MIGYENPIFATQTPQLERNHQTKSAKFNRHLLISKIGHKLFRQYIVLDEAIQGCTQDTCTCATQHEQPCRKKTASTLTPYVVSSFTIDDEHSFGPKKTQHRRKFYNNTRNPLLTKQLFRRFNSLNY